MTSTTTKPGSSQLEAETTCRLFDNWFDPIETEVRVRARGFIEELIRGELDEVLARPRYGRSQRTGNEERAGIAGHRHGSRTQSLTGTFGPIEIAVPRARLTTPEGACDPEKEFAIFSVVKGSGLLMVVQTSSGATNLQEWIAFAKKADKISMGTYAVGSTPHIVAFELNKQYGLKIEPIHYRGEAPMWADFMTGSTDAAIGSYAVTAPVLQSGRGKLIGATGARLKGYPEIQTLAEQGASSKLFGVRGFTGWWAPAGTPADILKKLSDTMVLAGKDARVQQTLASFDLEPSSNMAEAQRQFTEESPVLLSVLKDLGIQDE